MVRFNCNEISAVFCNTKIVVKADKLVGKVTGSRTIEGKEPLYYVDVKLGDLTIHLTANESQLSRPHGVIGTYNPSIESWFDNMFKPTLSCKFGVIGKPVVTNGLRFADSETKEFKGNWEKIRENLERLNRRSKDAKMPKERCIKLLESYRAEREKEAKGRKFERCLRESVVNEALERAIELLKEAK